MKTKKVYKVKVRPTGALESTTLGKPDKNGASTYRSCQNSILYVVSNNPKNIFDEFPDTVSIEEIGIGYCI